MSNLPSNQLFEISADELQQMAKLPGALRALADWHDQQESMAAAIGCGSAEYHEQRRKALTVKADRIEKEWQS